MFLKYNSAIIYLNEIIDEQFCQITLQVFTGQYADNRHYGDKHSKCVANKQKLISTRKIEETLRTHLYMMSGEVIQIQINYTQPV